jgi:surface polysaccharide O-acyltransferase-like enzyme
MVARDTLSGHSVPRWQAGLADAAYGAATVLAILAAGQALLNVPSPQLTYFSDAIMPVYLMHQVVIVIAGTALLKAGLPGWVEYPALLTATALIPLVIYHLAVRRFDPLRFVFGLKTLPMRDRTSQPAR